jgi:16S rRNA (cytosine1402-N4)-methyltransferase
MASCGSDQAPELSPTSYHEPALVPQVLELLRPESGQTALDLTVGTGGHALALGRMLGPTGLLIGIDADAGALRIARSRLEEAGQCPFKLFAGPFSRAPELVRRAGLEHVDLALADLGVGSHQLDDPKRGFSFESRSRLDMRYDTTAGITAWDAVNGASESELADVFHCLGEERYSRPIAAAICRRRRESPIESPAELAELIKGVVARRSSRRQTWRIHPATRVMMALRIFVNREMEELDALLELLPGLLNRGARAAVLTYHSLEARRVKHAWRAQAREGLIAMLTPSPVRPTSGQVAENPRVRSAQLRAARRL